MKITLPLIEKLLTLRNGNSLPASSLRGEWVEELLRDGVLVNQSHGSKRTIIAADPHHLEQALGYLDERLANLDVIRDILTQEISRANQAQETGNSKLVIVRSCPGFPINTMEPLVCNLNGKEWGINNIEGAFLFVADWQHFSIPEDVIVVGIENMENFRMVHLQKALFSSIFPNKRLLFVSRYPQSIDLRCWLQTISNQYVHFGDFDLAGINIFLTEFRPFLGNRASFLIPTDIEERLKIGSTERYNSQYQKFKQLSTDIPSLQRLIDLINKYYRGYDQEGYISTLN